jgi:hypothetical protein
MTNGSRDRRVLWVEDELEIWTAVERLCNAANVDVHFFSSGAGGLAAILDLDGDADTEEIVAVVSDMDLGPGPSGADVLDTAARAGIPVRVLFSGGAHSPDDAPAATSILPKTAMRHLVENVLAPLFAPEVAQDCRRPAAVPGWCNDHLTFDDAAEYLAALGATLSASTTIPEIALPIEGMGRFFEVMSGACRDAMATVAAKDVPAEVWGRATGDGRTELACALMDFCEAAGRAGAKGER